MTWRKRQAAYALSRHLPAFSHVASTWALRYLAWRQWGTLPAEWRLYPAPTPTLALPGTWASAVPVLRAGRARSVAGVARILGPRAVELLDGTVLDDVDAIVCCTGYRADWAPLPFVETSMPAAHGYAGEPLRRLYMNIFPPKHADSCAVLTYSAYGKSNGFSFSDVISMAVSNLWRGVDGIKPLPPRSEMEAAVDAHHDWMAARWAMAPNTDPSAVKGWEFQGFLHAAAGTRCRENLSGWTLAGWRTWWRDREMYNLLRDGVETAHMYRYFDGPGRRRWDGAGDEIRRQNRIVNETFPLDKAGEAELLKIFGLTPEDCVRR
jgi:dimethylaniline monooxygenase (N-oxide forming)